MATTEFTSAKSKRTTTTKTTTETVVTALSSSYTSKNNNRQKRNGVTTINDEKQQKVIEPSTSFGSTGSSFSINVDERTAKILWRDSLFLVLGAAVLLFVGFVEKHAPDADSRYIFSENPDDAGGQIKNGFGVVDTGFMLTTPLYNLLAKDRFLNDILAAINSIALVIPSIYIAYVTVWIGDYSLVFRILFTQILRSFCGWFTYLPPDPNYLSSYYDFPDIVHCLYEDCSGAPQTLPFVSFFSGHVATMVVSGNHCLLHGHTSLAVLVHVLNVFQIVRLLATRGHYSIDIIIGWYMAVAVSNVAGRLGRYYSRGVPLDDIMPHTAREAFETVTGVKEVRDEERMSMLMKEDEVKEILLRLHNEEENNNSSFDEEELMDNHTETTLKIIHSQVETTAIKLKAKLQKFQQARQNSLPKMKGSKKNK